MKASKTIFHDRTLILNTISIFSTQNIRVAIAAAPDITRMTRTTRKRKKNQNVGDTCDEYLFTSFLDQLRPRSCRSPTPLT